MACSEVPALVEEIDSALADGDFCLSLDGVRCSVPEKLLRGIRENLLVLAQPTVNGAIHSSYNAVSGGSDAHVVRGGVSTPRKSKASARADGGSVPEASSPSEVAGSVGRQLSNDEIARIVSEELRKAVMPLLAEIDAIAALLKECALEVAASKPARKRNAGKSSTDGTPISIRRGRTSVLVGSRKVS